VLHSRLDAAILTQRNTLSLWRFDLRAAIKCSPKACSVFRLPPRRSVPYSVHLDSPWFISYGIWSIPICTRLHVRLRRGHSRLTRFRGPSAFREAQFTDMVSSSTAKSSSCAGWMSSDISWWSGNAAGASAATRKSYATS